MMGFSQLIRANTRGESHTGYWFHHSGLSQYEICSTVSLRMTHRSGRFLGANKLAEMHEILSQLILKWARYGSDYRIDVPADFTRLTLDSIAICAMDTRFNSFYTEGMHPFVKAMQEVLVEAGRRAVRPSLITRFMKSAEKDYADNIEVLRSTALKIIADRRANPTDKKSLTNAMLNGKDPKTGEKMTNESIADNMITFLIAGTLLLP